MNASTAMNKSAGGLAAEDRRVLSQIPDDKAMLRAAAELTRDLNTARPEIYWPDMIGSALLGYALLAGAMVLDGWLAWASGIAAVFPLYRALLFIHEISHLHRDALPGFRPAWNLLVGIPMLTPSLMYEGVHTLHHARTRYGTIEDPEYMPLALMKPWSLPVFVAVAALAPVALIIRWAVLAPLSVILPPMRRLAWERLSALSINPAFRRRPAEGRQAKRFFWQSLGASGWALAIMTLVIFFGAWRELAIAMAVFSAVAVFNQLRTLVAHLWENDGAAMSVTAQYLDSVNIPPPSPLAGFWAPVGLRYHALHHLIPSLPYHSLAEAHRRIAAELGGSGTYADASHKGLIPLVARIAKSTMGSSRDAAC